MRDHRKAREVDRRTFVKSAAAGLAGMTLGGSGNSIGAPQSGKMKVAAVVTEFTYRSHAHVILENFLEPYLFRGRRIDPGMEVVALYVDQFPRSEIGREIAQSHGVPIYPSIARALCQGGDTLAVDAVLSIAEHGRYPVNAKGQTEYPRKRFFDEIVAVFEASGKVAPVFNDKHLSYRWDWAKEMVDTSRRLKFPLMAGSSVPLAHRRPPLELPREVELVGAVSIHGGGVEGYDFHGLELLQSMVEARKGGETGVSSVQFLTGEALWEAARAGVWSIPLADLAMAAEIGPGAPTLPELVKTPPFSRQPPHAIVLTYKDGFQAAALRIGSSGTRWNFASLAVGDESPRASAFYSKLWDNRCLFKALSHAIQAHFRNGKPPYPVERTLLTTGALDAAMDSRAAGGKLVATPHLEFSYTPVDFEAYRENGESWKLLTPDTPQPRGVDTSGRRLGG
ncbi:MAG: hypothetical protein AB7I30_04130 [Isosphaeraceae bacterium]